MDRFRTISLSRYFNSPVALEAGGKDGWDEGIEQAHACIPRGKQRCWGIPFALGPKELDKPGLIVLSAQMPEAQVRLRGQATHVCLLHFCNVRGEETAAVGEHVASYVLRYRDGSEHAQPIRRRFEVSPFRGEWGCDPFAAVSASMPVVADDPTKMDWGWFQTGVTGTSRAFGAWVYAIENPHPKKELAAIRLTSCNDAPVAVLGITLYDGPGHPLRHLPRRVYKLMLPAAEKVTAKELEAELDRKSVV